jgi:predicted CopG family antitoxin
MCNKHKLTTISVSDENYLALKRLGSAGDSFNDVITEVLKKLKIQQQIELGVEISANQSTAEDTRTTCEDDTAHE